jgi:hypothetical protein
MIVAEDLQTLRKRGLSLPNLSSDAREVPSSKNPRTRSIRSCVCLRFHRAARRPASTSESSTTPNWPTLHMVALEPNFGQKSYEH